MHNPKAIGESKGILSVQKQELPHKMLLINNGTADTLFNISDFTVASRVSAGINSYVKEKVKVISHPTLQPTYFITLGISI